MGGISSHLLTAMTAQMDASADTGTLSCALAGYVFVPDQCADKSATCRVHMVFHGCLQSTEFIGDQFVRHTGYNAWGAENGIIIVYPQTLSSTVNPKVRVVSGDTMIGIVVVIIMFVITITIIIIIIIIIMVVRVIACSHHR
jgi:poly(3-hydroxybutyrate) depolymerase